MQKKSGLSAVGNNLMATAFSETKPLLEVADTATPRGKGLQEGFKFLSMGAMGFWRNYCAHGDEQQMPYLDALAIIAAVSHLLGKVEAFRDVAETG